MAGTAGSNTPLVQDGNTSTNADVMRLRITLAWVLCSIAVLIMFAFLTIVLWATILDMQSGEQRRLLIVKPFASMMTCGFSACLMGAGIISVRDYLSISGIRA